MDSVTNITFNYGDKFTTKLLPLRGISGLLTFTTSSDEPVEVTCTLQRYDSSDSLLEDINPYKVKLMPDEEGYAPENYYYSDFISLINEGIIKMF